MINDYEEEEKDQYNKLGLESCVVSSVVDLREKKVEDMTRKGERERIRFDQSVSFDLYRYTSSFSQEILMFPQKLTEIQ